MATSDTPAQRVTQALAAYWAAYQTLREAIAANRGDDEAFEYATGARDAARRMEQGFAQLRADMAAGIAERGALSLTGLADRISMSRSRAAQFLRHAQEEQQ